MKNTTKISLMSGLMFAGMALGGIHIANAQNNVNPEIDNSRYTVMIPSEVNIDKNTGKGSFAVTGKVKAQSTIDVSIQSKNGYKLKDKNGELPYNIDKKSFSIDNSRSASDIPLNEEFNIASKTNTKVSGYYTDSLTFDITSESYKYRLDVNGNLDDNGIGDGRLDDFGRFDVYLNGKLVKENVEDFCEPIPYGTTWEIKNIRSLDGYRYKDSSDIRTKGVAGDVVEWEGDLLGDTSIYRITYVNLKFYSNKLTINYHADGAQSWKTANVNNASEIDVTGKDIMETEALKYDELYSEDAEKQHFCSIARIKRDGYTAKANTWKVGQNGSLEVQDNKILQKAQDVAKYCGVLNEFKKNDTTIDLYPIWTANTYTLTVNPNGGLINGDGSSKVLDTKLCFDTGNCWDINYLKPTRKGFEFLGWYDAPENGNIVYDSNGKCINNGNYWKDSSYVNPNNLTVYAQWKKVSYSTGTVLNIEGNDYIVMGLTEDGNYRLISGTNIGDMQYQPNQDSNGNYYDVGKYNENDLPETRYDEQNSNVYEDSYIDKYLESTYYNSLPEKLKKAIVATQIKQASYTNTDMNSKWRLLSKDTNPVSPDGTSNWFYNEGTSENPKYVRYDKVTTPDGDGGVYPLKYWTKKEKGYGEQAYNEITRHVYLPSVEEINNLVDLNNANKTYAFLKGTNNSLNHMWLRDASSISSRDAMILYYDHLSLGNNFVTDPWFGVRPAFVVDLSKIDYTVTGSVNYK